MQLLTRKFTIEQYHRMGETNIFHPEERLELIKGKIVPMSPLGLKHMTTVNRLTNLFYRHLLDKALISVQNSIQLDNYSEPQPDLVVAKLRDDFYATKPIQPDDICLLIEVSDSTIKYDQEVKIKIPLYAENKIQEVWLVNLNDDILEIYTQPEDNFYQNLQKLNKQKIISPLSFPDLKINLSDIFG
ncbi:Uma2 family endonuclease [Cyanobacterium sp. Dongsha4]|uniref:Uma2 family endonuclease n=1 Tax=Cyanobacterium sp. DS4 TaxID=2878255 RepID=UPI002E80288D|nr:Uma2 family endonuclease [Cyanobacterium sp. Dongsha4]WVL02265.1 Uma2 family endonuclease [Cyanobacterium sp. Dongsha4]